MKMLIYILNFFYFNKKYTNQIILRKKTQPKAKSYHFYKSTKMFKYCLF